MTGNSEFERLTGAFIPDLLTFCHLMLGSQHAARNLVDHAIERTRRFGRGVALRASPTLVAPVLHCLYE